MKFCKDCKWYTDGESFEVPDYGMCSGYDSTCFHPKATHTSLASGSKTFSGAELTRADTTSCGPTAKWFEEKEKPIPKCEECKWCKDIGDGFPSLCKKSPCVPYTYCARSNETDCGKYGKWWEKKEVSYIEFTTKAKERLAAEALRLTSTGTIDKGAIVEMWQRMPKINNQSWLCRLICGRKK